jgi:hypothetical protein
MQCMHPTDDFVQAADMSSTATLLSLLARLCWEGSDLDLLNAQLVAMSKKHGQLKEAVVRMVDEAMTYLPDLRKKKDAGEYKSGKDRWLELVKTLRDITEGKVGCLGTPNLSCGDNRAEGSWLCLYRFANVPALVRFTSNCPEHD